MARATTRTWAGRLGLFVAGGLTHAAISSWGATPADDAVLHTTESACPPSLPAECPDSPAPIVSRRDVPAVEDEPTSAPDVGAAPQEEPPRRSSRRPPKPSLTLARMPGTNQLRAGAKWDEEREAWALTFAYEIPAARSQVVPFYRKVLEDAGLEVTSTEGAPDQQGVVPVYLKGRRVDQHAHVTVRQEDGVFETRVRIIWRFYDGGQP